MAEPDAPSPAPSSADEGLRCPTCDYNLTGLTEQRCPECGQEFDRERLREELGYTPRPIPGWDDGSLRFPLNFLWTCLQTWFNPIGFGRRFPNFYRRRSAVSFRWLAAVCAILIFGLTGWNDPETWIATLVLTPGILVGLWTCELVVGATLSRAEASPRIRGRKAEIWGWGFAGFFRSYALISALLIGISLWRPAVFHLGFAEPFVEAIIVSVCFWWLGIGLAIAGTAQPAVEKPAVILSLPFAAGAGVLAGVITCLLLAGVISAFVCR